MCRLRSDDRIIPLNPRIVPTKKIIFMVTHKEIGRIYTRGLLRRLRRLKRQRLRRLRRLV